MTLVLNNPTMPHFKRWTKKEYNDAVDRGAFQKQRLFLYRRELIETPPMGAAHARAIMKVTDWAYEALRPELHVRVQMPFETPGDSMPEPDVGIFSTEQIVAQPHPRKGVLLVEVSDSSIELDKEKSFDYAAADVPEYWILDIASRQLLVYREPVADPTAVLGFRYDKVMALAADATISPLAKPSITVTAAEFLAGV